MTTVISAKVLLIKKSGQLIATIDEKSDIYPGDEVEIEKLV